MNYSNRKYKVKRVYRDGYWYNVRNIKPKERIKEWTPLYNKKYEIYPNQADYYTDSIYIAQRGYQIVTSTNDPEVKEYLAKAKKWIPEPCKHDRGWT